ATARARYLGEQLKGPLWDELGAGGKRFVEWFDDVLDAVDPSPPPAGARVHLLFDRYAREAREILLFSRDVAQAVEYPNVLKDIILGEVASARSILLAANRAGALGDFNASVNETLAGLGTEALSSEQAGKQFARTRKAIWQSILGLSEDGYTL